MPTMHNTIVALVLLTSLSLVACTETTPEEQPPAYQLGTELMTYADAVEHCESLGGSLAELRGSTDIQRAFDAWVASPVVWEAIWVGNWITTVEGEEHGYAMLRGGALVPVEMDADGQALPLCAVPLE